MKRTVLLLLTAILVLPSFAQQTDTLKYYLDADKKPVAKEQASYVTKVYKIKKSDSLWHREHFTKVDNKLLSAGSCKDSLGKILTGSFVYYSYTGKLSDSGRFDNGKASGPWKQFFESGKLQSLYFYTNGSMSGLCREWYESGKISDSFNLDKDGNGYGVGYYENGQMRYEGMFYQGQKKGTWKYYYNQHNGQQSMECKFEKDSLLSSRCFTPEGEPGKECFYEREAAFNEGDEGWTNYLIKSIKKSKFNKYVASGQQYTCIIKFMVDEEGYVTDVETENPMNENLDEIAAGIIRRSPRWKPAMLYNQPVKAYRRQPITFAMK